MRPVPHSAAIRGPRHETSRHQQIRHMTNEEHRPAAYDSVLLSMYSAVSDPERFWETLQLFESVSDAGIDPPSDTTISQHAQRLNDLLRMAKEPLENGAAKDDAFVLDRLAV